MSMNLQNYISLKVIIISNKNNIFLEESIVDDEDK